MGPLKLKRPTRVALSLALVSMVSVGCERLKVHSKVEHKFRDRPTVSHDAGSQDVALSFKGLAIRRNAAVLSNTLAKVLVLSPQGLCLELGRIPCLDVVHRVSLGGMDAYNSSLYTAPNRISVTSPNSLDRVVLSACIQRASLDLLNPKEGVIFKDVSLTIDGRLVLNEAIDRSLITLYQRAFLRDPTGNELSALKGLYEDIYKTSAIGAARNWMVLSCYAVLSSVEGAFY